MNPEPTGIFIPSLNRPERLHDVLLSIRKHTPEPHGVYVVVDVADIDSQRVCDTLGIRYWMDDAGWYWPRLQFLYEQTTEPWFFLGQDDIVFSPGWLTACFAHVDGSVAVVAPNDGHNAAGTSFLVRRAYIDVQGGHTGFPGRLHDPAYRHNFTDSEFVATAAARDVLVHADDVLVEHAHADWGLAERDSTYQRVQPYFAQDQALYESRRHLWECA